jgi:hypothetical protein
MMTPVLYLQRTKPQHPCQTLSPKPAHTRHATPLSLLGVARFPLHTTSFLMSRTIPTEFSWDGVPSAWLGNPSTFSVNPAIPKKKAATL